jgi:hypothetical protein
MDPDTVTPEPEALTSAAYAVKEQHQGAGISAATSQMPAIRISRNPISASFSPVELERAITGPL